MAPNDQSQLDDLVERIEYLSTQARHDRKDEVSWYLQQAAWLLGGEGPAVTNLPVKRIYQQSNRLLLTQRALGGPQYRQEHNRSMAAETDNSFLQLYRTINQLVNNPDPLVRAVSLRTLIRVAEGILTLSSQPEESFND